MGMCVCGRHNVDYENWPGYGEVPKKWFWEIWSGRKTVDDDLQETKRYDES